MLNNIPILSILAVGLSLAFIMSYISHKLRLPVIFGYLIAGYLIGPYSPGFVADVHSAEQLAEVGVVLMLFGVGLHFQWSDLKSVNKWIIPGALLQMSLMTFFTSIFMVFLDRPLSTGIVMGLSISVASTVILVKILSDKKLMHTSAGHLSIGWLLVEDLMTVFLLLFLPVYSLRVDFLTILPTLFMALIKFIVLVLFMFTIGQKIVSYILINVARVKSQEMLTLSIMAIVFFVAIGPSVLLGTSIPLGAFLAGMLIGKTNIRFEAAAHSAPFKNIFSVIFFLAVGMLFNPIVLKDNFNLFIGVLLLVVVIRPIFVFCFCQLLGKDRTDSIIIALSMAQIGEFSFILAEESLKLKLLPDECYDVIIAASIVSIIINPLYFKLIPFFQSFLSKKKTTILNQKPYLQIDLKDKQNEIVIIGLGDVGISLFNTFRRIGIWPIMIENSIDLVQSHEDDASIIYGDACIQEILASANVNKAKHLFITIRDIATIDEIIQTTRIINENINIYVILKNISEAGIMKNKNVHCILEKNEIIQAYVNNALKSVI